MLTLTTSSTPYLRTLEQAELRSILAELRRELEAPYGDRLRGLYLFGSYARGDADPGSDIDVAVVLENMDLPGLEIENTGDIVSRISLETDTVVSLMFVDRADYEKKWTPFLANLREEGVPV